MVKILENNNKMSTCGRTYIFSNDIPAGAPRDSDKTLPSQTVFLNYGLNFGWSGGDNYGNYCNCDEASITKMNNPTGAGSGGSWGGTPDTSGATWKGCADCHGGNSSWDCCGCCISSWNPANKENCCNPTPSVPSNQNPSWYCDPNWCPWSDACLVTDSTKAYCTSHPTDPQCVASCMQFATSDTVGNAPSWCESFISNYCHIKNNSSSPITDADKTICACSLKMTSSDECLWSECQLAPNGQTWKTPQQYKNINDPNYCTTECKNIMGAVEQKTAPINTSQYTQVCGNVPLPGNGGGGGGGNNGGQSWSDWFESLPSNLSDWFESLPTYMYAIIGIIIFIIIIVVIRYLFYSKPKPKPSPSDSSASS